VALAAAAATLEKLMSLALSIAQFFSTRPRY